jgi:hypothetical protein
VRVYALIGPDWESVFVPSLAEVALRGTLVYLMPFFVLR